VGHLAQHAIETSTWIAACIALLAAALVPVFVGILALILMIFGILWFVGILQNIAEKIDRLAAQLSASARDSAVDAGFVAVIGIVSALVAYLSTEDFLNGVSTLKIFAAAAVCYAALKALMLIPVRSTQILSAVLTLAVIAGSVGFLNSRHPLFPFANLFALGQLIRTAKFPRQLTACAVALLSLVSLFYPFTPKAWKRILVIR
jgi:hypothetical protein